YATAVTLLPGSPIVYGASAGPYDTTIVRYLAQDGTQVGAYSLQPNTTWTMPYDAMKITPNGSLVYILRQQNNSITIPYIFRIGIIGSSTLQVEGFPMVATPAGASPNPTTSTTTNLSVLGADTASGGSESNLTYTWSVLSTPVGATTPT